MWLALCGSIVMGGKDGLGWVGAMDVVEMGWMDRSVGGRIVVTRGKCVR